MGVPLETNGRFLAQIARVFGAQSVEYLPPVVIEHALPSDFGGGIVPRLHFCREKESFGVDYDSTPGIQIGARYGDTAHIGTGAVHDQRWMLKITVRFGR